MLEAFQIFLTMIGLILVVFVPIIISSNREHARNLKQPKIERIAKIIDKRVDWVENSSTKNILLHANLKDRIGKKSEYRKMNMAF